MKFRWKPASLGVALGVAALLALVFGVPLVLARSAAPQAATPTPAGHAPGAPIIGTATTGSSGSVLPRSTGRSAAPPAVGGERGLSPLATPDVRAGPPAAKGPANSTQTTGPVGAVTAQFIRPLLGAHVRAGEPITVTYSVSAEAGLASVQLWADGSLYARYSDPSATLKSLTRSQYWSSLQPGRHALTVVARDAQGHSSSTVPAIILVTGEPEPLLPEVNLLSPPSGGRIPLGANVPVTITASSPTGITRIEFWRDWGLAGVWQSPDSSGLQVAGVSLAWTASMTGTYTLWAAAYDLTGLKTATQPITVAVYMPASAAVQPLPTAEPTLPVPMATFEPVPQPSAVPLPTITPLPAPVQGVSPLPTPALLPQAPTEMPSEVPGGPPPAVPQGQSVPTTPDENPDATSTPESP